MSASTAIGSVSASLQKLLRDKMRLSPTVNVTLLAPDENGPERRVNLFLYRVEENPYLKNMDAGITAADPTRVQPPPLSLDLFYLMTVYAPNDADTGNAEAHHILGEAMRVLHENSPLPRSTLLDDLPDARELLRIAPHTTAGEELATIWTTFSKPYRPVVAYQVSVVQLDTAPDQHTTVPQRVRTIGLPAVGTPPQPPVIDGLVPVSGPSGTPVTLSGQHLTGRHVSVTVGADIAFDGTADADTLTVAIPAALPAGCYEIVADVGAGGGRTFLFEVTV